MKALSRSQKQHLTLIYLSPASLPVYVTATRTVITFSPLPRRTAGFQGVKTHKFDGTPKNANECDGYAASANGVPIRCLAIDTQGRRLAVGSECVTLLVLYH